MALIPIQVQANIFTARRQLKRLIDAVGFSEVEVAELELVVSELGQNLLKHALDGALLVQELPWGGVQIAAIDRGPGIVELGGVLADHNSTAGSMGCGLGAVRRFSDDLWLHSTPEGTVVVSRRHRRPPPRLRVGLAGRPMPGESESGDGWWMVSEGGRHSVLVVDSLGHGSMAAESTREALRVFCERPWAPEEAMFEAMHGALRRLRGAAVTLVRLDRNQQTLTHTGVGNVEVRIHPSPERAIIPRAGVVGYGTLPPIRTTTTDWSPATTVAIFTDGIKRKCRLDGYTTLPPMVAAPLLLGRSARRNDDATAVIISGAP